MESLVRSELVNYRDDLTDMCSNLMQRTHGNDVIINDNLNWIVRRFDEMASRVRRAVDAAELESGE